MDSDPLATMVAGGIVTAFALGFVTHKLRLSPIIGYLLAGMLIGPHTSGLVANADLAGELADLGTILIMFGVGLRFSPAKLSKYHWIALPCALGQMALITALGLGIGSLLEMSWVESAIFGFSLSVASTVVLLRGFEARRETSSPAGHLAVSWLIAQNIAAVFLLVVMSVVTYQTEAAQAESGAVLRAVGIKTAGLGVFVLIMLAVGRRLLPWLLVFIARAKSRELFSLGVFSLALGIAYAAHAVFGASFTLGAFLAGVILNETDIGHRAAEDLIPLREAFAVLFFVSVGMLFDPQILVTQSWVILAVVMVIVLGNGGVALLMTAPMRAPLAQRVVLASSLAQIGEFSFLIGSTGVALGLISEQAHNLISAGAFLSIVLNPMIHQMARLLIRKNGLATKAESPSST